MGRSTGSRFCCLSSLCAQPSLVCRARRTRAISDLNASINDMNVRIDDVKANVTSRIDDLNARINELRDDIRELRALVIDVMKPDLPSAD